jgi:hypothetical protein
MKFQSRHLQVSHGHPSSEIAQNSVMKWCITFLNILFHELRSACLYNNVFEIISVQMFTFVKQMYECVLISALVLKKLLFGSLSVYSKQAAHV